MVSKFGTKCVAYASAIMYVTAPEKANHTPGTTINAAASTTKNASLYKNNAKAAGTQKPATVTNVTPKLAQKTENGILKSANAIAQITVTEKMSKLITKIANVSLKNSVLGRNRNNVKACGTMTIVHAR